MKKALHELNRLSWNTAAVAHNRHKGDQAAFFRIGGSTLFPEESELLGDVAGLRLLHLQCNAGQNTLSVVRDGADATGQCLVSMLVRLKIEFQQYWPIDRRARAEPCMTIFVERIAHSQDKRGEVVAWFDVMHEGLRASASIVRKEGSRIDDAAVELREGDGIFGIAIELLRKLYPTFA